MIKIIDYQNNYSDNIDNEEANYWGKWDKISIKDSKDKIKSFYPEINITRLKYYTKTWLLSKELDKILDENSNIIKFKNKFDVIQQTENIDDFLSFVFKEKDYNIKYENLKEDTILQKELKKYLMSNEKLHIGLGVLK